MVVPVRPADDAARALAMSLLSSARHAALAVIDPDHGGPAIGRIAFALAQDGAPMTLVSSLSTHAAALIAGTPSAIMLGEPGAKGDPLTHPRLMLRTHSRCLASPAGSDAALRKHWLSRHPKARLYIDFADFSFFAFDILDARLNAGFGKAFRLSKDDLQTR
jgi:heme iron utilization protein